MVVSLWDWFPFTFFALFVLVLNGLLILLYQREISIRQSATNRLIANQCIGNILTSFVLIPCYCASLFDKINTEFVLLVFAFFLLFAAFTTLLIALEKLALFQDRLLVLFDGNVMKALVLIWTLPLLVAFIPAFTMIGVTRENRTQISHQYSIFLFVMVLILLTLTLLIMSLTVVLGSKSVQKKTDQLADIRNINEAVEMQHSINEDKIHLGNTWKILVPLLLILVVSASPSMHLLIHSNNKQGFVNGISLYVFCLKGLFDPIITFSVIADYQEATFQYLGGRKFR